MSSQVVHYWKDWRLHAVVLGIVIVAELIGTKEFSIGMAAVLLLPMLYAVVIGLLLYFTPLLSKKQSKNSEGMVLLGVSLLTAKFGVEAGPALEEIAKAGPALILQELGNIGTIALSVPIAVMIGLKRETIGMTYSIGRESNLAIITEKFGISSPEGRGVMSMYIFGTLFGAIFFSLVSGTLSSIVPISPLSFAMATGVGSGSMTAAALGPLVELYPNQKETIIAFSGVSNLLTTVTGLYMSLWIALPLTEKYYSALQRMKSRKRERKS